MTQKPAGIEALRIHSQPLTLREIALERMRDAIIAGVFEPGQRLVERVLCDQLGVSRSVIREVIRHLEAEGLVEMLAKQGPIVARLDWNDARQIYDIRAALESSAVADCARNADLATKARLGIAYDQMHKASQQRNAIAVLAATTEFYEVIFLSGGHHLAWEIVRRLNSRISRLRVMTLSSADRIIAGPQQLKLILDAIEANDPIAAEKACRHHVAQAALVAERVLNAATAERKA